VHIWSKAPLVRRPPRRPVRTLPGLGMISANPSGIQRWGEMRLLAPLARTFTVRRISRRVGLAHFFPLKYFVLAFAFTWFFWRLGVLGEHGVIPELPGFTVIDNFRPMAAAFERAGWARAGEGNRTPITSLEGWGSTVELHPRGGFAVGARGFEPPTPCSQSRCATRLRHAPPRPGMSITKGDGSLNYGRRDYCLYLLV
jgi:hypothetical protein